MPIANYPAELVQIQSARSGFAPVCLLDVIALDGTSYHWANVEISAPAVYTGTQPVWAAGLANPPANYDSFYFPWLLSASGFHFTRSMESDTGNIFVQNVSGNTLQRDLSTVLTAITFEGALFAFREWNVPVCAAEFEMHGRLTIIGGTENQVEFGANQLFNPNDYDGNPYAYSETCQWRYASPQCGDTTNNPCLNSYTTCRQPNRFFGVLNNVVVNLQPNTANVSSNQVQRRRLV